MKKLFSKSFEFPICKITRLEDFVYIYNPERYQKFYKTSVCYRKSFIQLEHKSDSVNVAESDSNNI